MLRENIYITILFLSLSFLTFGQLTLQGVTVTLSDNASIFSTADINIYNTSVDTSKLIVNTDAKLSTAGDLNNKGLIVNHGTVEVADYLTISDTAMCVNEKSLIINGDFNSEKGSYIGEGVASVKFSGGVDHYVKSRDQNVFRLLQIEDGNVVMESDLLTRNLHFISDKIICSGFRLGVMDSILGANDNSYVEGLLARIVKSGDYVMPVGFDGKYRPVKITGVTDSTLIFMEVYTSTSDLDQFGELKEVDEVLTWDYSTDPSTYASLSSPFKIGVAYNVSDFLEIGTATASHRIAISDTNETGYYSSGGVSVGIIGSGLVSLYSTSSVPASGLVSIGEVCALNEFAVSALLEGPNNGASGLMNVNLTSELKNKYEFSGTNAYRMRDGYTVPANAVDVLRVVLRDNTTYNRIDTAYAWLMDDGGTKDFETGQQTKISFCDVASSSVYVQVEHRNHLSIMSANAYPIVGSVASVNLKSAANVYGVGFTTGYNNITFNNDVLMYSGDSKKSALNVINAIDYSDVVNVLHLLPSGYLRTDFNLSGSVESGDNDLGLDNSSWLRKSTVR